ncbi:acyl transferase/acyl hydrolase/lysophospholipase [Flagelloscypha sp. PMI_526]|nr:acyl transferase/acyl hydrolase/lysophospholipase [Flagelloscypha sp. PMI_526]
MSKGQPIPPRGLRLLSFDGGGLRALSQAKILQETTDRIAYDESVGESGVSRPAPRVADHFDMVCGSGFGGLLAIMAGILGMNGKELVDEFTALCLAVFSGDASLSERTARLELEIKRMVKKYSPGDQGEDRRMISDASPCKVFVCVALSDNLSSPRLLRNYKVRSNASPDCKVWEAAVATCALVGIFRSITIGSVSIGERFVGGEVRWNNPTHELTVEVANIFADHDIACIVSVGSGHPAVLSLSEHDNNLFRRITEDCEEVANDLFRRFSKVPDLYWRLSVEQGIQGIDPVDIQELTKILASTRSYLQTSRPNNDVDAMISALAKAKGRTSVTVIAGQIPAVAETVCLRDCPPPTMYFIGQRQHLTKLRTYFANKAYRFHIAVLSGLGGAGKTQCGLTFVQLSLDENRFTEVFFLDASDQVSLETGFQNIAQAKGVGESFEDGIRYLRMRSDEWLLFLDNADNPKLNLGHYLHPRHGNVLITTRNPHIGDLAPDCHCRIDRLDQADAKDLLLRGVSVPESVDRNAHATEIVEVLGCHALAVNQARAFLAKGTCALSDYLRLYEDNRERLLRDHPSQSQSTDSYKYTVYATWTISFNCLSETAKTFLQIICFMHHEAIPLFIFNRACEELLELETGDRESRVPISLTNFLFTFNTEESTWDELYFLKLIEEVRSFSLVEFDSLNQTISLHPLVQQWAQHISRADERAIQATQTILALSTPIGKGRSNYATRKLLLLHFRDSLNSGPQLHHSYYWHVAQTFRNGGLYTEASSFWERDLEAKRRIFGSEHPDTLASMNNLAVTYSDLARHADALKLKEKVVELRRRILGSEHPHTLTSMGNLANTYSDLARHAESLKLKEKVLELCRRILGSEHPDTLTSISNLAVTYSHLARHGDALKLKEEVMELRRRILGPEHPDTLASMHNLAKTYYDLHRYTEAGQLQEKVVELSEQVLNNDHPDLADERQNLRIYRKKANPRKRDRLRKFLGLRS